MIYALCIFVSHYPKPTIFVQKLVKIGLAQFGSKSQFLARKFKDFKGFYIEILKNLSFGQKLNFWNSMQCACILMLITYFRGKKG